MGMGRTSPEARILKVGIATQATAARASTVGNYLGLDNSAPCRDDLSLAGGIYIPADGSDQFAVAACRVTPTPGHYWDTPRDFFLGVNTIGRETFHMVAEGRLESEGEGRVFGVSGHLAGKAIRISDVQSNQPTLTIGDSGTIVLRRIVPHPGLPNLETQLLTAGVWGFAPDLPPVAFVDDDEAARQIQVALDNITRWRERISLIDDHDHAASMWRSAGHAYDYCNVPWTAAYCFLRSAQRLIEVVNRTEGSSSVLRHYALLHQLRHDLEFALTLATREPDLHKALEGLWEWTNLELASYPSLL